MAYAAGIESYVDGSAFIFSTYLGGSDAEYGRALKVNGSGDIYLTGYTASTNFPTVNAFQPARADGIPNPPLCFPILSPVRTYIPPAYTGFEDVFVAKLKGDGSALVFSTYLGGRKHDDGQSLAIGNNGDVYVTGLTGSIEFPTADPLQHRQTPEALMLSSRNLILTARSSIQPTSAVTPAILTQL
jgi:beta-propeller repeat-containing protein